MNTPLISIIIPNFNGADYISATIDSIINQTYPNWELLIVDDCSTDNSIELINQYVNQKPDKIHLHQLEKNSGGPATPRNHALGLAKGEYIAFVDSDDIWHPEKLETQINIMLTKNLNFTCSIICEFHSEDELVDCLKQKLDRNEIQLRRITHSQMLRKNRIRSGSTSIVNKKIIDQYRLQFNTDKNYVAVEDYLFWMNLIGKADQECYRLETPLTFYRISLSSISQGKYNKHKMAWKIFNLLSEYLKDSRIRGLEYFYFFTYFIYSVIDKLNIQKCRC